MILWELFITFFEIGAVSFGGGYAMISMIREKALAFGWLTEDQLLNMIAVAESTPGPIAVNMATFVGSTQGGIWGSLLATLGVVLPSFLIILLISAVLRNFLNYKGVQAFLKGVRPCVVGLILGTAANLFMSTFLSLPGTFALSSIDFRGLAILGIIIGAAYGLKKITNEAPSPIVLILLSAGLGILFYGI